MIFRIALATGLAACFVLLLLYLALMGGDPVEANPRKLVQSSDCRVCHPEVFAEWEQSWHAMAWRDPLVRDKQQADDFKKKDCIPCHAPRPIFERGFRPGERVVERVSLRDDGVDCISCHRLPDGGFASATEGVEGPCRPVFHPGLRSEALCAPCHNQHDTVNEWLDAPAPLKGESCNDCHMPVKERKGRDGRPPRKGRDHTFPGGHFKGILLGSFSLYHEVNSLEEARKLRVRIVNDKTGHNLPTDSRHRALDLILTFYKTGGLAHPPLDGDREFGQEPGTYRLRFRNPYRSEAGMENTQIPAGEEAVLEVPVPENSQKALIQVVYKLTPFMTDAEGVELVRREINL